MSFHLYKIDELYSNADGTVQFIELHVGNNTGEGFWQNHAITVTQGMTQHSFTFSTNLPDPNATANTFVLIATQGFADLGIVTPNFIVPDGFLFTSGAATVNYAGVDSVAYSSLPTDGMHSIDHGLTVLSASPQNFAGASGVMPLQPIGIATVANQVTGVGQLFDFTSVASAFLNLDNDAITYSALTINPGGSLPGWLSVDSLTGAFSGTPAGGDVGTIHVELTADDDDGAPGTRTFDITVIPGLVLTGTGGADTLTGGAENDIISGLAGNDLLDGGAANDTLTGGLGNDTFGVDGTDDSVNESSGQGTDLVQTSVTLPSLAANVENLTLLGVGDLDAIGNSVNNVLTGNDGNNTFNGAGGADTMVGGDGDDTFLVDSTTDQVVESLNQGTDLITTAIALATLSANVENLTLTGGANITGIGNGLANVITGNTGSNFIAGGAGNDTLDGGAGNDNLNGGSGNDAFQFSEFSSTDRIVDFNSGSDQIYLDDAAFTALGLGAVAASQLEVTTSSLVSGTSGDDAGGVDYLKYTIDTGELYYDDNGTTTGGLHLIAILASPGCSEPNPTVDLSTAQDIVVV